MATLFRATVMLAVLVGLPGAWIYYGPLPTSAQKVVDRFVAIAKEAAGWEKSETAAPPTWDFTKSQPLAPPGGEAPAYDPALTAVSAPHTAAVLPMATPTQIAPPLPDPSRAAPPATEAEPTPTAATLAERVKPLLTQLRQFGVAEYALERWGGDGKLFRFHCEMPLGAGGAMTQQFEAVTGDPQASVEQVVAEVSRWRLARQVSGM